MKAEEAEEHYKEYLELVKTRKEKYVEDLKKTYFHLSEGRKVLDIYEVFKNSGLNENGEPKLGIAPANSKTITFEKMPLGSGTFTEHSRWSKADKSDVHLPTNTFPNWKEEEKGRMKPSWETPRVNVEARVPIIPAHIMPEGDLKNYYILFEVKEWFEPAKATFTKGDPYLLKRINQNAFAVLAEWDVTDVEAAILRGY
jgi:hypothetical protein